MKKILSLIICLVVVISLTGCNKGNKNNPINELKDEKENVKLVFENEIEKDVKLETKISDNYIKLSDEINKYVLYNISLVKYNGNEKEKVSPGNVTVSVKIPSDFNKDKLVVYYVSNYVIMENYEVEVDGEYAKFKTNHFSGYALAELK